MYEETKLYPIDDVINSETNESEFRVAHHLTEALSLYKEYEMNSRESLNNNPFIRDSRECCVNYHELDEQYIP